jgi:hypothetical protein
VGSHDAVRAALQAHPTAGEDQQAMVRDVCQGGAGVALVVGRAGTGKTFVLGMARHAWQLDGYQLLACAPTGIATVSLEAEGFDESPPATASWPTSTTAGSQAGSASPGGQRYPGPPQPAVSDPQDGDRLALECCCAASGRGAPGSPRCWFPTW